MKLTQDGEEDVDAEIGTAPTLEEDTDGGEDDGKDDLADIAGEGVSYLSRVNVVLCIIAPES